jgi:bifunctional UDP-N-acetylglucosamine pyrophosphorylase / glucosamine-1-phosphate N-acetyltransferase
MTSINKKKIAFKENLNQEKLRNKAMKIGVTLISPETVFLSNDTKFGKNVVINPYVVIGKKTIIGSNVEILPFSHIENATLKKNVKVGPFSRIRPGTILLENAKVGNFVEIKKSKIGKNSKISHLSYIGDSYLGKNVNIGAGTITCNYDGKKKNKTKILDGAFIGSNSSLVAPVKIGKKSTVGAGSVITKNVKEKSLALTRSNQQQIKKFKKK